MSCQCYLAPFGVIFVVGLGEIVWCQPEATPSKVNDYGKE